MPQGWMMRGRAKSTQVRLTARETSCPESARCRCSISRGVSRLSPRPGRRSRQGPLRGPRRASPGRIAPRARLPAPAAGHRQRDGGRPQLSAQPRPACQARPARRPTRARAPRLTPRSSASLRSSAACSRCPSNRRPRATRLSRTSSAITTTTPTTMATTARALNVLLLVRTACRSWQMYARGSETCEK
jgi:hypothetical protein